MKNINSLFKSSFAIVLSVGLIFSQVQPISLFAQETESNNDSVDNYENVEDLFEGLYADMIKDVPKGQEILSYTNNYQSMEPETMTFYSGSGSTSVNNGLTVETVGNTVAAWEKAPFLSSGVMEVVFQVDKEAAVLDMGVSLKSNSSNAGVSVRYEKNGIWVVQEPSASGIYKTFTGKPLAPNIDYTMRVAHHGNRLVVSIDDTIIFDDSVILSDLNQGDILGQFGLYSRNGSNKFEVTSISIKGVGSTESSKVRYEEDYETTTTNDLNWVNASSAKVIEDGTGNKVLEITAADRRITDLNSPNIKDGTLSLKYKVQRAGAGFAFGFRHNDNSSVFSEIGIDGVGVWVPESSNGWGSNLGLPVPEPGIWNDLMFNFEGKQVTIYLNKELIGVRSFDKFTDNEGKFGLRLRNATLLIDDVIYTEEILTPEIPKEYVNDFEDGITGNWSNPTEIIQDGKNGILQISGSNVINTLQESADLELNHGTMKTRIKPVSEDVKFQFGNATIEWAQDKWVTVVDNTTTEFVGDAVHSSLDARKWNNVAIKFSDNELVFSINGKEATATLANSLVAGHFGIGSTELVYLDDFLYTEKLISLNTESLTDKFEYEEHFSTETIIDYTNLLNSEIKDGRLNGVIEPGKYAINNEILDAAHGVYQFKLKVNQNQFGFNIGNTTISIDDKGLWTANTTTRSNVEIGSTAPYVANSEIVVRLEVLQGNLSLFVNSQLVNTVELADYVGGSVGIYNPNTTNMELSLDSIAVEELRVYEANYANDSWKSLEGNATFTKNADSVTATLPGVAKAIDAESPKVLDHSVSFDFTTSVDHTAAGGRYGFTLRTVDEKEYVAIEHDINGVWRASYSGNEYRFPVAYPMAKDTTYHIEASVIGTNVSFKVTDEKDVTVDLGTVDIKDLSAPGHFGLKSWFGAKDITIGNLKMVESPTLANWYLDSVTTTLENDGLSVEIDEAYPRIISYEYNGKSISGQKEAFKTVFLNGVAYEPLITSERNADNKSQDYTLLFTEIGVEVKLTIAVEENQVVAVNVTEINESSDFLVRTFSLGENTVLYTDSSKEGSSYAQSTSTGAWHGIAEELVDNTADMQSGGLIGTTMSMISENGLAASIENNVMSGGNKVMMQKELKSLIAKVSLRNGTWTYRHAQSEETETLPWFKVVIGEDQNDDKVVDWQDAAVLYRENIYTKNFESEDIANNMMYIAFNFASQANDPFLNSLENGKVLYNYTDGFGQMVLHKGYQAEGHDDDIPSYSNIGVRQGGEEEFRKLIEEGKKYNLNIGVHLNATEYHLDANELMYDNLTGSDTGKLAGGWDWIDASYYVDQTKDVLTGELQERFRSLTEIAPGLDFFYIDVYTGNDYNAYKLLEFANDLGIKIGTEFSGPIEPGASFVHWGPDLGYPNKGNASTLSRIVKNDQDIFVGHSLFKGQKIPGVTTWGDSKPDMQQGVTVFYNDVLPTKYMQHFGVMKVEEDQITFDENVTSKRDGKGMVELRKDGKLISTWKDHGTTLDEGQRHTAESLSLIPWKWDIADNSVLDADNGAKLYHWNPFSTSSEWELTDEFKDAKSLTMYELTQHGKVKVADVAVVDGKVQLDVEKNTPYVLYKSDAPVLESATNWGEGSPVADFAFNAESLDGDVAWSKEGEATVETVPGNTTYLGATGNLSRWNKFVKLNGSASISQQLDLDLVEPGKDYTVSVWVEVEEGQEAVLEVELDGKVYTNYVTGKDKDHQSSFKYVNTNYQRLSVKFNVPEDIKEASIKISSAKDVGVVLLDDVRFWQHLTVDENLNNPEYVVYEDFENVHEGWGPLEYISGSRQTHIASDQSNKNDNNPVVGTDSGLKGPVMTWVLDGENSLKMNEDSVGRGVKTNEDRVKLIPNTNYELSFAYTMNENVNYTVEVKSRSTNDVVANWDLKTHVNNGITDKTEADYNVFSENFTTGNADDYQVIIKIKSIKGGGSSSLKTIILDNFAIKAQTSSYETLQALIKAAEVIENTGYTASSWKLFQEVLADVKANVDESSSAEEISDAVKRLTDAKDGLAKVVGLDELNKAIKQAKTFAEEDYSTVTFKALETALSAAQNALTSADNDLISDSTQNLLNAIEKLVNVSKLKVEIEKMEAISKDDYTSESYNALQAAITLAKELLDSATSADQVTAQIKLLKDVKAELVVKGDVSKLAALIEAQKDVVESEYTEISFKEYSITLEEAVLIVSNDDSSQADIDAMIQRLTESFDALVPLNYNYTDPKTGVQVDWVYGVLAPEVSFEVKKLSAKSKDVKLVEELYAAELKNLFGYNIVAKEGNVEVLPNGKVVVKLPIGTTIDPENVLLFNVNDGGVEEVSSFMIINDVLIFETDIFGSFVIAEKVIDESVDIPLTPLEPSTPKDETPDKPGSSDKDKVPPTGISSNVLLWISSSVIGMALLAILAKRKKTQN